MTNIGLVRSLCDYAKKFVKEYSTLSFTQEELEAVVSDFLNYFSYFFCGCNLSRHARELRNGEGFIEKKHSVSEKAIAKDVLYRGREAYKQYGILKSINKFNAHMNDCKGKANFFEQEAVDLIGEFIESWLKD